MKNFLVAALVLLAFSALAVDPPETILPKTKEIKPLRWYAEQSKSWREKVEENPLDAAGWLNYYSASRYAQSSLNDLNNIAAKAEQSISGSFESKIIKALNLGYSKESHELLKEAYRMNPENAGTYGALVLFEEFNLNTARRQEFSKKLLSSGLVSQTLLSYSYNVLMSVEKDAILFVEGDNTTLPLFILQDVLNIRKDVKIFNLDLFTSDEYRRNKIIQSGLKDIEMNIVNTEQKKMVCSLLPIQNPDKKFYYALTIGRDNTSSINNQLYVVGLVSENSKTGMDNITLIKENLEKRFLLDYLKIDFNGESEFGAGKVLSSNYLVPMLLLYEHYAKTGESAKMKELETLVTRVASQSGKDLLVRNMLDGNQSIVPYVPFAFDNKRVEETMRIIGSKLFAQNHEVTNEEYNMFLQYLTNNKFIDLYNKCRFDLKAYEEPALSFMKNYTSARIPVKKNKFFNHYPAVNISYESALAYCDWLTEQYNHAPERKYKTVKFRLPNVEEWQLAAASIKDPVSWKVADNSVEVKVYPAGEMVGKNFTLKTIPLSDPEILYPWFRLYSYRNRVTNGFGCYLGNFKLPDDVKPCTKKMFTAGDGFIAMGPVESYFPNDIGLYDVVGNVAEMTDQSGTACGGSWNHTPEESTIKSINTYTGPDAAVGFRIFMEVIEK